MRNILILLLLISTTELLYSQTNSISLKDGSGVLINQYSSIQEAYNAIPSTITHPYTIEINSSYNGSSEVFPITFNARIGTSGTNKIVMRPAPGNSGELISANSPGNPLLILDNIDYMTIDGRPGGTGPDTANLTIENTATDSINAGVIVLRSGAANNNIQYIKSIAHSDTAVYNICVGGIPSTTNNNSNVITGCNVIGGETGIYLRGFDGVPSSNNSISKCKVYDFAINGIKQFSSLSNTTIEKNEIFHTGPVSHSIAIVGINISYQPSGTNYYRKNKIYDLQSSSTAVGLTVKGILLTGNVGFLTDLQISNNFISLAKDNNDVITTIGIELNGSEIANLYVYYNSVFIGGTQSTILGVNAACIKNNTTNNIDLDVRNNLFYMGRQGFAIMAAGWYPTLSSFSSVNRNDYHNTSAGGSNSIWQTTQYTNLAMYRAAAIPNEQLSYCDEIFFVSNTNLHLTGSSIGNNNIRGSAISGITDDIDGDIRSGSSPYF